MLYADGFDDAILGGGQRFNDIFVVYDRNKLLDILVERDGMKMDEAIGYYESNIVGGWVGDKTPAFVVLADAENFKEWMEDNDDEPSD